MKAISAGLAAHLAQEVTTLATCWKLTRRDGAVLGFTDHDQDVLFDGVTYQAESGFTPSAVQNSGDLRVDNLDLEGVLRAGSLREEDIRAGLYDFAGIDVFLVNYRDTGQGALPLRRGWLGEVALAQGAFVAEMRGLTQRLSQSAGELYSATCRATLGDGRCRVNLAAHTVSGTVTAVTAFPGFSDSARSEATGLFSSGRVTFAGGANAGLSMEIRDYALRGGEGGVFTLALPLPYPLQAGDAYSAVKGCDKMPGTCAGRFANMVNFRGEPLVPGLDRMLETAGTRSDG
jgi:uncharacterized phage protein (TIGR02218 family)